MEHEHNDGEECVVCNEGMASYMANIEKDIKEYGWAYVVTGIDTEAGLVRMGYTVGLSDIDLPEVIVFGLPPDVTVSYLNEAAKRLKNRSLVINQPLSDFGELPVCFKNIPADVGDGFLNIANERAEKKLASIQLIWSDPKGLFPWDAGFDANMRALQPILTPTIH